MTSIEQWIVEELLIPGIAAFTIGLLGAYIVALWEKPTKQKNEESQPKEDME